MLALGGRTGCPLGLALRLDRHQRRLGHGHLPLRLGQCLQLQGEPGLRLMLGGPGVGEVGQCRELAPYGVAAGL